MLSVATNGEEAAVEDENTFQDKSSRSSFSTPAHVQQAYEQAYYDAVGQPDPEQSSPAQEQVYSDPLVGVISDATQQRLDGNSYQQPYSAGYQQALQDYQQSAYTYQQATQTQQQTYYTQAGYYPYVASKDHVAAGLLALFLGPLGIHKFYLGYNNAGFIMLGATILGSLFTFGLAGAAMGVIAFIEAMIYFTKPQSVFDAIYVQGRKEWF